MSKLKLRIQLDEEFEVDLKDFNFEGLTEKQIKKELLHWYYNEIGHGEIKIETNDGAPILGAVQIYQIKYNIEYYEIKLGRALTTIERIKIDNWVMLGQKGSLKL